jgi:sarcosine oxidase subunit gamma
VTVELHSVLEHRLGDLALVGENTGGEILLEHVPFLAQIDLRLDPRDAGLAPIALPLEENTAREDGARAALWLGPDEWLILGPPGDGPAIASELRASLAGAHHSVVDVSANRVALDLSGSRAKEILSKGCSLDLELRGGWTPDRCAQTLLARVPVILHERVDRTTVFVRPSFAEYLVDWFVDAASR